MLSILFAIIDRWRTFDLSHLGVPLPRSVRFVKFDKTHVVTCSKNPFNPAPLKPLFSGRRRRR